ncbi:hypothetical protein PG994_006763 [Apiospora phragmitis]|uniref:Uncharacterized protein n=1 Tax=Apiospora phragmitis TaxID=2905665 RepID=A0ABR1VGZ9_9PEZI
MSPAFQASAMNASASVSPRDLVMAWATASANVGIIDDTATMAGAMTTAITVTTTTTLTLLPSPWVEDYLNTPVTFTSSMGDYLVSPVDAIASSIDYEAPTPPATTNPPDHHEIPPPTAGAPIIQAVGDAIFACSLGLLVMIWLMIAGAALMFALYWLGVGIYYNYRRLKLWWQQRHHRSELIAAEQQKQQKIKEEKDEDDSEEKSTPPLPSTSALSLSNVSRAPTRRSAIVKLPKKTG